MTQPMRQGIALCQASKKRSFVVIAERDFIESSDYYKTFLSSQAIAPPTLTPQTALDKSSRYPPQ